MLSNELQGMKLFQIFEVLQNVITVRRIVRIMKKE